MPSEPLREQDVYFLLPRIGAFEVSYKGIVIYSKLRTQVWPNVPSVADQMVKMFKDIALGVTINQIKAIYSFQGKVQV